MMRVGMIGIGDIAQKGYLPVLSTYDDLEIVLCTRNKAVLGKMANTYKIKETYTNISELIESGIEAAFVHSSTDSHAEICEQLLDANIHVFVDKPIAYDGDTAIRLIKKAEEKSLIFMVGFNRRFAPPYERLRDVENPNLLIVEKHRLHHPDITRTFIFDDFIHVIDTLLNYFPYDIKGNTIDARVKNGKLHHVVLQLHADEGTAIGIMNRDSGMNEEIVKMFSPKETIVIKNINEATVFTGRQAIDQGTDDWQPTLEKRGFYRMTRAFINAINDDHSTWDYTEDLVRHTIAEEIVQTIEKK